MTSPDVHLVGSLWLLCGEQIGGAREEYGRPVRSICNSLSNDKQKLESGEERCVWGEGTTVSMNFSGVANRIKR